MPIVARALSTILLCALAACGSGGPARAPRVAAIPEQHVDGAGPWSFDLADHVVDPDGGALTFAVTSGSGAFAGSTFTTTLAGMGAHTIAFAVTDSDGNRSDGAFVVNVRSGNFAAVLVDGDGMLLVDVDAATVATVAADTAPPTFVAGLAGGQLVYELNVGGETHLWLHDPVARRSVRPAGGPARYVATTSDDRILLATGSGSATALHLHNATTGLLRGIATGAEGTALVAAGDLVYHHAARDGQSDLWCYDAHTDESFAVSTDDRAETLLAVLADGAAVFARLGPGGEPDLFCHRRDRGVVEIGADLPALASRAKTWLGSGNGGEVVFSVPNGAATELFAWDPATGQTAAFATGGDFLFHAVGPGNEVLHSRVVSAGEQDLLCHDLDDGSTSVVRDGADVSELLAVTAHGGTTWAVLRGSNAAGDILATRLGSAPVTVTWAAGGAAGFAGQLTNGDVIAARANFSSLARFDVSAGAWEAAITGGVVAFAGDGVDDGDFVYTVQVAGQDDLRMWDQSANGPVTISDDAAADSFGAAVAGCVLFVREVGSGGARELFVWRADGGATTQLISSGCTHNVLGTWRGSR